MNLSSTTDSDLLAAWVHHRDESAFHELVVRYAGLVQMAAQRTCWDRSLAADASQLVFTQLAQSSKSLLGHPSLAGWLHVTASMKAKSLIDKTLREDRKRRHFQSAMDPQSSAPQENSWQEIQPYLTDAVNALSDKDREAILLRFYRSMSIKEIAATLGLTANTAQKRLDRATERLREKLTRRGVTTAGSLSAVMLAGFSADAQAAVISTSVLSSKAIAASASGGLFTPLLSTMTTTKAATCAIPIIALLMGGSYLYSQAKAISQLKHETAEVRMAMAEMSVPVALNSVSKAPVTPFVKGDGRIDWAALVIRISEKKHIEHPSVDRLRAEFSAQLETMSREQLIAELDKISALDAAAADRDILMAIPLARLASMDRDYVLNRFLGTLSDGPEVRGAIHQIFADWAKQDPADAAIWLNQQIAAEKFPAPGLDGKNEDLNRMEAVVTRGLLQTDPAAAEQRLSEMSVGNRIDVLFRSAETPLVAELQTMFSQTVRNTIPPQNQGEIFAEAAGNLARDGDYQAVTDFMSRMHASDAERVVMIDRTAVAALVYTKRGPIPVPKGIDEMRAWLSKEAPNRVDALTGKIFGMNERLHRFPYAGSVEFLLRYHEAGAGDEILTEFLANANTPQDKDLAVSVAMKISDAERRAKALEALK